MMVSRCARRKKYFYIFVHKNYTILYRILSSFRYLIAKFYIVLCHRLYGKTPSRQPHFKNPIVLINYYPALRARIIALG